MGSATTPSILRYLIVPDPRFDVSAYNKLSSSLSQAGPLPGVPEAQDETEMVLEAVGTQSAATTLNVKTIRPGHPDVDRARFIWKYGSDAADEWRGWDPPVSLTGFEFVDRTVVAGRWTDPHVRALADGTVLCAVNKGDRYVVAWVRDPDTGTWTEIEVYDNGTTQTYSTTPCLVELPSGRVLCFFWREDGAGNYQIRCYYSDDSGANWTPGSKGSLDADIDPSDYVPGRIRGDYLNGQIMLIVHMIEQSTPEDRLFQYGSNDLGATLDLVVEWDGKNHRYADVLAYKDRLYVGYVAESGTSGEFYPYCRSVASAYSDFTASEYVRMQDDTDPMEWGTESGGLYDSGDITMWADEDGCIYVLGRDHASGEQELAARFSRNLGATWKELGGGLAAHEGSSTWRGQDADSYFWDVAACGHRGRAIVLCRSEASPATADDSLMALYLGGYTTVCMAQETESQPHIRRVTSWQVTWLPIDYPEDIGNTVPVWAASSSGTPTLTSSGMRFISALGQTEHRYTSTISTTVAQGLTVLAECKLVTGQCRVELRISDNTPIEYEIACIVSTTEIKLWDLKAGAIVGSAVATTDGVDGFIQILVDIHNDNARMWYRPVGPSGDRKWIEVASTGTLTSAAVNNGAQVLFGQHDDAQSYWRLVCYTHGDYTGEHLYGQDNWSELLGRGYQPTPVYVDGGTSIQAVDGPTFRNDDWEIACRYEYPIQNVFPDVATSPRRTWRSTTDSAACDIVWNMGNISVTPTLNALIGLYLGNANFGVAELDGENGAGAWVKVADVDLRIGSGLKWSRSHRFILPDPPPSTGNAVAAYLPEHVLAGDRFAMDDGQETKKVRVIETNGSGRWMKLLGIGGPSKQTRLLLESVLGTEPANGTDGEIWARDYALIIPLPLATKYRKWRLRIPAQTTAEGYFQLGTLVWGNAYPIGGYLMGYGWGRKLEWAYDYEQVEGRTGIRTVQALGPTRRAVEVGWVDGVETSDLMNGDPNYVVGWVGGEPVVVPADAPYSVPGLVDRLQGATTPVVYVATATLPATSSSPVHVTGRNRLLYGRVVSETLTAESVLGEESNTELLRLGVCRIEEEV